jgi:hypothetical protein
VTQTEAPACGTARDCLHASTRTTRLATFHFRVLYPRAQIRALVRRLQASFNAGDAHTICTELYAARDVVFKGSRQGCIDTMKDAVRRDPAKYAYTVSDVSVHGACERTTGEGRGGVHSGP